MKTVLICILLMFVIFFTCWMLVEYIEDNERQYDLPEPNSAESWGY